MYIWLPVTTSVCLFNRLFAKVLIYHLEGFGAFAASLSQTQANYTLSALNYPYVSKPWQDSTVSKLNGLDIVCKTHLSGLHHSPSNSVDIHSVMLVKHRSKKLCFHKHHDLSNCETADDQSDQKGE